MFIWKFAIDVYRYSAQNKENKFEKGAKHASVGVKFSVVSLEKRT